VGGGAYIVHVGTLGSYMYICRKRYGYKIFIKLKDKMIMTQYMFSFQIYRLITFGRSHGIVVLAAFLLVVYFISIYKPENYI